MAGKGKGNPKQIIIFLVLITIIFAGYFYMVNKRGEGTAARKPETEAEKLLSKDLSTDYPATPTAVVKLYSRISKNLYNEKWKNKEVNQLVAMMRRLYSVELLENNPEEDHLKTFKADIAEYHDKQKRILTYKVDGSSHVEKWEKDGSQYVALNVAYSVAEKKESYKIYEKFILKKEESQWKIIGWTNIAPVDIVE